MKSLIASVALIVCFSCNVLFAQSIITDRPDQTESSFIVPDNHWQFEMGFSRTSSTNIMTYKYEWSTPSILVRYAVNDFFELRMAPDFGFYQTEDGKVFAENFFMRSNEVGFKVKLAEEKKCIPQTAFIFHMPLHWFTNEYSPPTPEVRLTFSHSLSDRISLGYNLGMEWLEDEYYWGGHIHPNYIFTLTSGISLTEKLSVFIETFGTFNGYDGEQYFTNFDGGFTYLLRDNMQLDLSGGWGFYDYRFGNEHWQNYFLSLGFSFRVPD